ncbi:MAG: hypothetical protein ALECFALPRED_006723 [Alectoria fallacina]|uniref:Uncharacterized protein n=1 Tax=Alectoria fallacina TaxID=1903189 RepID=A0A8H3G3S9_9LECA|nr:MAG: hypothetical protein ALECFALPRED_006723 [Alectoria fallacina]
MSDPSAIAFLLDASALACAPDSFAAASPSTLAKAAPKSESSATGSSPSSPVTASTSALSATTSTSSREAFLTTTRDALDYEIVVAHYNEDLTWLKSVIEHCKVYSKGGPKHAPESCFEVEALENIGREGHTYLHHIVKHYESLKDVVLFTQGRVDDHINLTALEMKEIALQTKPGRVTTFPHRVMELFDLWDGIPWEKYPCWAKWSSPEGTFKDKKAPKTPAQYFKDFFDNFGHDGPPMSMGFQPGAIFAVRRETIHQHPKELYQKMLEDLFLGEMKCVDPETGHYFERFWPTLFRHEEYCCWDASEISDVELNDQGQLAKGRWHATPRDVEVDVGFTNKP